MSDHVASTPQLKADVLVEALPYIRRFAGKEGISFAVEGHRTRLVIFRSATSGHPFKGRRGGLK